MKVQECIALLVRHHGWIFQGSSMQVHPAVPANCNYGGFTGGHRERRYKFTIPRTLGFTETITFSTQELRCRASRLQNYLEEI